MQTYSNYNQQAFIELLQFSIGTREELSRVPSVLEWEGLLDEAERQAVEGLLACGVDRLPKEQQPPKDMKLQWGDQVLQIEQRNAALTFASGDLCRRIEIDGFRCCVLKGQANHAYYPSEMAARRTSGDIDIWLEPMAGVRKVRSIIEYVEKKFGLTGLCWLHANSEVGGVPVEEHFRPSFFSRPRYNNRFQRYFADLSACVERKMVNGVEIPSLRVDEDVIYQMSHIYRHLIDEGVGLRQVVDYYFVLKAWNKQHSRSKEETMEIVSWLGMKRFAGALMYVLHEVLGMPDDDLLCPASKKDGSFLINEILMSGNFGHSDPRMEAIALEGGYLKQRVSQAWRRLKRNMRFVTSYPGEVIWEPIVRVEHFMWKKLKLWRY